MPIGIGTGNPGVEKGYPYPNPEIPVPSIPGTGISGLGWRVPLVPGVLSQVVRKPGVSCRVHHSACEGILRELLLYHAQRSPLHRTQRSATASHTAIHCGMQRSTRAVPALTESPASVELAGGG
jgi:hypothetical protein